MNYVVELSPGPLPAKFPYDRPSGSLSTATAPPLAVWRPLAYVARLVILPFSVKAVIRLLRALKPLDPPLRVRLDAYTANSSLLIVVGAPSSGPSSSTPSYYDRLRRINSTKPN